MTTSSSSGYSGIATDGEITRLEDIEDRKKHDEKVNPPVSTAVFLAVLGLGVPIWAGLILPTSIIYQVWKALSSSDTSNDESATTVDSLGGNDEEEVITPKVSDLTPLKDRKYDLVLLGATGFTGKLAASYLTKTYGVDKEVKWAIAGRSPAKLEKIKSEIAKELGNDNIVKIDTIIVDTSKRSTIPDLVKDTRAVVSTAGPFSLYGSNVVEFCAKYGTNYVDTTGETDWSKSMIAKWDNVAQSTGAKIISFCANDCAPWDLTVHMLSETMANECNDDIVEVQCLDEFVGGGISGGTLATMLGLIEGDPKMKSVTATPAFDFDPFLKKADGTKSNFKTKTKNQAFVGKCRQDRFSSRWLSPFVMAGVNAEVVKRSQALRSSGNACVTYREASLERDFKTAFVNTFVLFAFFTGLFNPISGSILKSFLPKPGQGPTEQDMENGYLCVYGFGTGSRGNQVESVMYFPKDSGYMETARMVVEAGLCLAIDTEKVPVQDGGFFTPATGMGASYLDRLCNTGTVFRCKVINNTLD